MMTNERLDVCVTAMQDSGRPQICCIRNLECILAQPFSRCTWFLEALHAHRADPSCEGKAFPWDIQVWEMLVRFEEARGHC